MTQLPERLRALAEEAPLALSAEDLWETGRRRHRGRVLTALATAAVVVTTVAVAGFGSWHAQQPDPTAPEPTITGPIAVPSRFFHPSPWLPGTSSPGRLVALLGTERGHFPFGSDLNALVGVAAGSQTYRFLDLPGQSDASDVALSPNGRHIAYWISGTPPGAASPGDRSTVGVANLDVTTGKIQRRVLPSQHGLLPVMLTWTENNKLAVATGHLTSAEPTSYSSRTAVYVVVWKPGGVGDIPPLDGSEPPVLFSRVPHSGVLPIPVASTRGYAAMVDHRVLRTYDANDQVRQTVQLSGPVQTVAYDARARRVAGTNGNPDQDGSSSGALMVGDVVKGHAELTAVPGGRYLYALGWADADHVVTEQLTPTGELFWVVDVHTGARTALTGSGYQATGSRWFGVVLAADALRAPTTVAAVEPPRPWNPRWVAGGSLAVLLLVGAAGSLLLWRRRRVRA